MSWNSPLPPISSPALGVSFLPFHSGRCQCFYSTAFVYLKITSLILYTAVWCHTTFWSTVLNVIPYFAVLFMMKWCFPLHYPAKEERLYCTAFCFKYHPCRVLRYLCYVSYTSSRWNLLWFHYTVLGQTNSQYILYST